ncbi:hypothetical protein B7C42_08177 [Nocardia cerradoensis]|uniref:Uncharacterized protein n=1 Tax=Nocardia cerradoensis TaxID=85688 RepID=A0A231GT39_9NOCA|nr:hypothetical protein B7C42_08177 [Nocardia cerradoensis]
MVFQRSRGVPGWCRRWCTRTAPVARIHERHVRDNNRNEAGRSRCRPRRPLRAATHFLDLARPGAVDHRSARRKCAGADRYSLPDHADRVVLAEFGDGGNLRRAVRLQTRRYLRQTPDDDHRHHPRPGGRPDLGSGAQLRCSPPRQGHQRLLYADGRACLRARTRRLSPESRRTGQRADQRCGRTGRTRRPVPVRLAARRLRLPRCVVVPGDCHGCQLGDAGGVRAGIAGAQQQYEFRLARRPAAGCRLDRHRLRRG